MRRGEAREVLASLRAGWVRLALLGLLLVAAVRVGVPRIGMWYTIQGWMHLQGELAARDYPRALERYQRGCELGRGPGCENAGDFYDRGRPGVRRSPARAAFWHARGCEIGHAESCESRARTLREKDKYSTDAADACDLVGKACALGLPSACAEVGLCVERGVAGPADPPAAAELYESSCGAGDLSACFYLANLLAKGVGVPGDEVRAGELFLRACSGGLAKGCRGFGDHLAVAGDGLVNADRRVRVYKNACDGDDLLGCVNLGKLHAASQGGIARAIPPLEKACDGGESQGCLPLDNARLKDGPEHSPEKALKAYERGCRLRGKQSCFEAGKSHEYGVAGPRDAQVAAGFFQKACDLGHKGACADLGTMFRRGTGLSGDEARARALISRACTLGDEASCTGIFEECPEAVEAVEAAEAEAEAEAVEPSSCPPPSSESATKIVEVRQPSPEGAAARAQRVRSRRERLAAKREERSKSPAKVPLTPAERTVLDCGSSIASVRERAITELVERSRVAAPEVFETVLLLADDPHPASRRAAVLALVALGSQGFDTRGSVTEALDDSDPRVSLSAAAALAGWGEDPGKVVLFDALDGGSGERARIAVRAIVEVAPGLLASGEISSEQRGFHTAMTAADSATRHAAASAVLRLPDAPLETRLTAVRTLLRGQTGVGVDAVLTELTRALSDRAAEVRSEALRSGAHGLGIQDGEMEAFLREGIGHAEFDAWGTWGARGRSSHPSDRARTALTALVSDADPRIQARAVEALLAIGTDLNPMVPELEAMLASPRAETRAIAASSLLGTRSPPPEAGVFLNATLLEIGPGTQRRVLGLLQRKAGRFKSATMAEGLAAAVAGEDSVASEIAIELLQDAGQEAGAAAPALVARLRRPPAELRPATIRALGSVGIGRLEVATELLTLTSDPELRGLAFDALARVARPGDTARVIQETMIAALSDPDPAVRASAAQGLKYAPGAERAGNHLAFALESERDAGVRVAIVETLGRGSVQTKEVSSVMLRRLGDADPKVRRAAIQALATRTPPVRGAAERLCAIAGDSKDRLQAAAIAALAQSARSECALSTLLRAVANPDAKVRESARAAVAKRTLNAQDRAASEGFLHHPSAEVRAAAVEAFGRAGPLGFRMGADGLGAVAVLPATVDSDRFVRRAAWHALARLRPSEAQLLGALPGGLSDPDAGVRRAAVAAGAGSPKALPLVRSAAKDAEAPVRAAAVRALATLHGPESDALPWLGAAIGDPDEDVRKAAAESLEKLRDAAGIGTPFVLLAASSDEIGLRRWALRLLAASVRPGPEARAGILHGLSDTDASVRAATALGLAESADPEMEAALIPLLGDGAVGRHAASALGACCAKTEATVAALASSLSAPEQATRVAAATALRQSGDAGVVALPRLLELMNDPADDLRKSARQAVASIGPRDAAMLAEVVTELRSSTDAWRDLYPALVALGPDRADLVGPLLALSRDPESRIRVLALNAIAGMGPAVATSAVEILPSLDDSDRAVRAAGLKAITALKSDAPEIVTRLSELSRDTTNAREVALILRALAPALREGNEALATVTEHLVHADADVRRAALEELRDAGPRAGTAAPAILARLDLEEAEGKPLVIQAAVAVGAEREGVARALVPLLGLGDEPLRDAVTRGVAACAAHDAATFEAVRGRVNGAMPDVRHDAAWALAHTAMMHRVAGRTDLLPELQAGLADLESVGADTARAETIDPRAVETLKNAVEHLKLLEKQAEHPSVRWMRAHPYSAAVLAYAPVMGLVWSLGLWLWPLGLLRLDTRVRDAVARLPLPYGVGELGLPLSYVLLLRPFVRRDRTLDHWVGAHLPRVREAFRELRTERGHGLFVAVPIFLDQVPSMVAPDSPRWVSFDRRSIVVIRGPGGAGKTALACQLALAAGSEGVDPRGTLPPMLPLLLEDDPLYGEEGTDLCDVLRERLARAAGVQTVPRELMERLLRRRRVLVIVDGYSEMSEAARAWLSPEQPDFPVSALVVTSRFDESFGSLPRHVVDPQPVALDRLTSFVHDYLEAGATRARVDDTQFARACRGLARLVGTGGVTPLFARLYVDVLLDAIDGGDSAPLPENILGLLRRYLQVLNRRAPPGDLVGVELEKVVGSVAWASLSDTLRPGSIARRAALEVGGESRQIEDVLPQLEGRLGLLRVVGGPRDRVCFVLDPVAEYLAAAWLLHGDERGRPTSADLVARIQAAPESCLGFATALLACGRGTQALPSDLADRLARAIGEPGGSGDQP